MAQTILQYLRYHFMTSEQVRAARMLLRWEQKDLAERAGVSLPSIKRLETQPGPLKAHAGTIRALQTAFEDAGVEFIAEGETSAGAGAGVRLKAGA
ncbi:transcriptional regulator [Caenispirillum bisanense]|uniref:helix-turn-helix domain-containing protein n=1 Tax=Caenispirillum bisanense TaxID=414052 RepID=UPI0031DAFD6E